MFFRCLTESIWPRLFTIQIHASYFIYYHGIREGEPARVRARRDALMFDGQAAPIRPAPRKFMQHMNMHMNHATTVN